MKLSVVIVNYNVKHFLEQCLYSVQKATQDIESEVIVVDNNSVDGSLKLLRDKFPEVVLLENHRNVGFARANNQAILKSSGEYVLLLNPDTVVEGDTFRKALAFLDSHPEAGGLGVKMIDGKGRFLPESKRSIPTPKVALFKIVGLARLFPRSKTFGKYHLGYLDKDRVHQVEVLSGAFMMLRKSTLDKTGLLDETFFMYGEDIDLSYRILQAGYKNYYYPLTRIIHYKGESTRKSSINYVFTFYNAMIIFARKHFSRKNASLFSLLINMAIYLRAFAAILFRLADRLLLPFLDLAVYYAGMVFIASSWEKAVILGHGGRYPDEYLYFALPIYILIWLLSVYFSGGYDRPLKLIKVLQGLAVGTVTILVLYALLPETYRFSRALILIGAVWGLVALLGTRLFLHILKVRKYNLRSETNRRFLIAGQKEEAERVAELLRKTYLNPGFIGLVSVNGNGSGNNGFIGSFAQINDIIGIYRINEVIFCAKDLPAEQIIDKMSELHYTQVEYKIAPPESLSIIGSKSINTSRDLYILDINSISKLSNRRNKRFFDLLLALGFLPLFPITAFIVKNPAGYLRNILLVLAGRRSWVGYHEMPESEASRLPSIRKGILDPSDGVNFKGISAEDLLRLNLLYARDYRISADLMIIFRSFRELGRSKKA